MARWSSLTQSRNQEFGIEISFGGQAIEMFLINKFNHIPMPSFAKDTKFMNGILDSCYQVLTPGYHIPSLCLLPFSLYYSDKKYFSSDIIVVYLKYFIHTTLGVKMDRRVKLTSHVRYNWVNSKFTGVPVVRYNFMKYDSPE